MSNLKLLAEFLRVYAFQPATAYWRAIEVDILRKYLPTAGSILDLGCGDGKLSVILFENALSTSMTLVGIDNDEFETRQAEKYCLYLRIHTCLASNIPEPSMTFDHVISNSVLEHIENIDSTIAEVARLLKPDGTFVFTVPSDSFHQCLHGPLFPFSSREAYFEKMDKHLAHYRYWSINHWRNVLGRHELRIEHHHEYLTPAEIHRWETLHRFTVGLLNLPSGNRFSPMEIQKKLGLRYIQNRLKLPFWLGYLLAKAVSIGISTSTNQGTKACLLISARKND